MKLYEKMKVTLCRALIPLAVCATVCLSFFFLGLKHGAYWQKSVDAPFLAECVEHQKKLKNGLREIKDAVNAERLGMKDSDACTDLCYSLPDVPDSGVVLTGAWGWKDPTASSCACFFTPER